LGSSSQCVLSVSQGIRDQVQGIRGYNSVTATFKLDFLLRMISRLLYLAMFTSYDR